METAPESTGMNFYELLGVAADSSFEEIKRNYRKLALKYHPDKIANSPNGDDNGEKMKDLARAYSILSDDKKRGIYDQYGMEGLERSELLSKDQSILPYVNKLWMCGLFGWVTVLVVDYIVGIPVEWVIIMIAIPVLLLRTEIPRREKSIALCVLCAVDLVIYLLVPSGAVKFLSNVLVITGLIAAQNSIIKYVDFSTFVWVVAVLVEYMRELDAQNFWIYLLGINVLAISLFTCGIFYYYFQTQFVLEGQPSTISDIWNKISPSISAKPLTLLIFLIPLWILSYFTTLNLESILFLSLLIFTKISNKEFKLLYFAIVISISIAVYYYVSPSWYYHMGNILIYYFLLRILSLEESVQKELSAERSPATPTTESSKESRQVNVEIDTSNPVQEHGPENPLQGESKVVEVVDESENAKSPKEREPDIDKTEEMKTAMLLRATKYSLPSYSYFVMFLIICYIELNREVAVYLTYLSIFVFATAISEIFIFEAYI